MFKFKINFGSPNLVALNIAKPEQKIKKLTYRAISKINYIQLCKDIDYHILNNESDLLIVDKLMAGISYCLNIHAPLKHKLIIERPKNLWYNAQLAKSKQLYGRLKEYIEKPKQC